MHSSLEEILDYSLPRVLPPFVRNSIELGGDSVYALRLAGFSMNIWFYSPREPSGLLDQRVLIPPQPCCAR